MDDARSRVLAVAAHDLGQALGFIEFATTDAKRQINSRST
jgi:hypothetical protein